MLEVGKCYKTLVRVGVYPAYIFSESEKYKAVDFSNDLSILKANRNFTVLYHKLFKKTKIPYETITYTPAYVMYYIWSQDKTAYTMFRVEGDQDLHEFEEIC